MNGIAAMINCEGNTCFMGKASENPKTLNATVKTKNMNLKYLFIMDRRINSRYIADDKPV
jgi:hypothetical protein